MASNVTTMNMNHMNMNGANGAGGGMPMMQNGTNGASRAGSDQSGEHDYKPRMNTYIYDYFIKQEQYDCAKFMLESGLNVLTTNKPSPGHRTNGIDDGDHDSKDDIDSKRPHNLPYPDIGDTSDERSFLLEWFSLFWDMFLAASKKKGASGPAMQYVQHNQLARMQQEQRANVMRGQGGLVPPNMANYQNMLRMQGGMVNANELRQRVTQNGLRNMTPQQLMARNSMMQHQQMERGGSDADMNGQRPRTPSAGDNAPSPSKRARLDPQFSGQQIMQPNGRPPMQAMQTQQLMNMTTAQSNNRLLGNGINPQYLTQAQLETFQAQNPQVQEKSIQVYAQNMLAQQKRQSMPGQGSPMINGMDVGGGMPDFYPANVRMTPGGQPNGAGNHALQDYQMQLMLLEQQNKKRLLMARQEQDNLRPDGQPPMPGQPGYPAGTSPQGSRSGPSPNPSDQMKRGTPNIGQVGLPGTGSPMPDGSMAPNRGSPGPMNFGGQLGPEIFHQGMKMGDGMVGGPNGTIMRPPSSNPQFSGQVNAQMEAAMRAQAHQNGVRIPNGVPWQQGQPSQAPMMPQVSQAQQPMGTPLQRTMPPPSGLPANGPTNGRPASPSQSTAAPPTPQPTNKAAPKGKKEGNKDTRKRPPKKGSMTAATPSSEAENPPPTPTPSTPITPMHPKSFNDPKTGNAQSSGANAQAPTSAPAPAPVTQPQPELMPQFSNVMDTDPNLDMPFADMSTGDVLEGFDFDSFLQDGNGHLEFDASSMVFGDFPMETGNVES